MRVRSIPALAALLAGSIAASVASAVTIGQTDDFEDGTTQGWVVALLGSSPLPPTNVSTGGPAGSGDHFLLLQSQGNLGAGSRLVAINVSQWTGDYTAAGVTAIAMDLENLGDTQLSIRVMLADPAGGPPADLAVSTAPIVLDPGSGWHSVVLPVTAGSLTAGVGTVDAALSGATELRIYHGTSASFPGGPIAAALGVDNIRAVPEAGTAPLVAVGLALVARVRRRS